eukprot:1133566-Amphidinium_carterae.1
MQPLGGCAPNGKGGWGKGAEVGKTWGPPGPCGYDGGKGGRMEDRSRSPTQQGGPMSMSQQAAMAARGKYPGPPQAGMPQAGMPQAGMPPVAATSKAPGTGFGGAPMQQFQSGVFPKGCPVGGCVGQQPADGNGQFLGMPGMPSMPSGFGMSKSSAGPPPRPPTPGPPPLQPPQQFPLQQLGVPQQSAPPPPMKSTMAFDPEAPVDERARVAQAHELQDPQEKAKRDLEAQDKEVLAQIST